VKPHLVGIAVLLGVGAVAGSAGSAAAACIGDCDGGGSVTIDELLTGVGIALQAGPADDCDAFDADGDDRLVVKELVQGLAAMLGGCPPLPTATPSGSPTVTSTPTATATPTSTPLRQPSDLAAVIDGGAVRLSWTNPDPSTGITRAQLLRRLNEPPTGPDDAAAALVFAGSDDEATDDLTLLLPDTPGAARTYHYAVYGCSDAGACETAGSSATLTPEIGAVLRAGGYSVYFRHGMAAICQDCTALGTAAMTTFPDWWKSCDSMCVPLDVCAGADRATPRQISPEGVSQAQMIGDAFRTREFPVGRVLSSEFCRCVETAENMAFGPPIETVEGITFFVYDEVNRCAHAREALAERPVPGTNTAIVAHGGFTCDELTALEMGDGAIYKPDGDGGTVFIATVRPAEWAGLP
jgi:hypothetical protein